MTRDYDTTVARIAGNILSGMTRIDAPDESTVNAAARWAVSVARAIAAEVKRTQTPQGEQCGCVDIIERAVLKADCPVHSGR